MDALGPGRPYGANASGHAYMVRFDVRNLTSNDYWQDASLGLLYEGAPRTFRLSISTDLKRISPLLAARFTRCGAPKGVQSR